MAAPIYTDFQALAAGLLRDFDQGGIYLLVHTPGTGPAYNPGSDSYAANLIDGAVARGVSADMLRDTLINAADLLVTIPGTYAPKLTDRVRIKGRDHAIVRINTVPAAGPAIVHKLVVRA